MFFQSYLTTLLLLLCGQHVVDLWKTHYIILHSILQSIKTGFDTIRPEQMAIKLLSRVHLRLPELYHP